MSYLWIIPAFPAAGAAINGLAGIRLFPRRTTAIVACLSMAASCVASLLVFLQLLALPVEARSVDLVLAEWIPKMPLQTARGMGFFEIAWGLRLDPLAGLMLLIVTGIGLAIHIYATAYMHDEPRGGYARFFAYLNLFCFFMLVLVLGSNFLVMFVGWEGVGLCSYLLVGFWYQKPSACEAGKKAFVVNRMGDWGFLLGMFLVYVNFGTLDFHAVQTAVAALPVETHVFGALSAMTLLLFVGAIGKSAQFPLYIWLPDAMEGPTPVSALIHAATMVTAGVYMLGRNAALFSHAPMTLNIVMVVGLVTAMMAAAMALVEQDIKRVLAYSTISQLGYMFTAVGAGAFAAGAFHLMTHAFFKALLFLGSGSVIHAMAGEQNMRRMGGLRRYLPITFVAMAAGALAMAGVPPLSGFFSKDEILHRVFLQNRLVWLLLLATSLMTAIYIVRLIAMVFFGVYRGPAWERGSTSAHGHHGWRGPIESPQLMTAPLMALAIGAMVAGFFGLSEADSGQTVIERFLEPAIGETGVHAVAGWDRTQAGLMLVSTLVALAGVAVAWRLFVLSPILSDTVERRWARVHRLLRHHFYVDELYASTIVKGTLSSARMLWTFDRRVVDGLVSAVSWFALIGSWMSGRADWAVVDGSVNLIARLLQQGSHAFRRLQSGLVQNYALLMLFGVMAFVSVYLIVR